jgi:excisionase family DNA binding protein
MKEAVQPEPLALGVPDVARALSISAKSVWNAIGRGEIRTVRVGHRVLVTRAELDRILSGATAEKAEG